MNPQFREHKRAIRAFLATRSDERLMLLDGHSRAGWLNWSCPEGCLAGIGLDLEFLDASGVEYYGVVSNAFYCLAQTDSERNRIVLPMIRAEIARRARALTASETREVATV